MWLLSARPGATRPMNVPCESADRKCVKASWCARAPCCPDHRRACWLQHPPLCAAMNPSMSSSVTSSPLPLRLRAAMVVQHGMAKRRGQNAVVSSGWPGSSLLSCMLLFPLHSLPPVHPVADAEADGLMPQPACIPAKRSAMVKAAQGAAYPTSARLHPHPPLNTI